MQTSELVLFTGPHCGLCKKAEDLLYRAGIGRFENVDVTSSLDLKKKYGLKIPVLKRADLEPELFWPFDERDLAIYLELPGIS